MTTETTDFVMGHTYGDHTACGSWCAMTTAPYSGPTCGHLIGEIECGEPATLELVSSDAVWSSAGRHPCCDEHGTSEYLDTFRMGGIRLFRLSDGTEMSWVDVKALELGILAG